MRRPTPLLITEGCIGIDSIAESDSIQRRDVVDEAHPIHEDATRFEPGGATIAAPNNRVQMIGEFVGD
jgi:hypothetical protein